MSKFYPLTVAKVKHETRDAIAVTFDLPPELKDAFAYQQGQHLTLRATIDGEDVRRSYSICSAVQDDRLRVAIKRVNGGLFSTWANECIRPGVTIDVMPPEGRFNLPLEPESRRHYLAFAAGSGITPILSIIKTTLIAEPHSRFTLLYGNRASSSVIFRDELTDLKDQYLERLNLVYIMSREPQDIELFHGRITEDKCRALFQHWLRVENVDYAFICGPEDMMHGVSAALQEAGMPKERIRIELFAAGAAKTERKPRAMSAEPRHLHDGQGQGIAAGRRPARRHRHALLLQGRRVLDLPLQGAGGAGRHGRQLRARGLRSGARVCVGVPEFSGDGQGGGRFRRA
jgi:ring-1,2-phenylacetyl-CoA epoxidase subunit PaaE